MGILNYKKQKNDRCLHKEVHGQQCTHGAAGLSYSQPLLACAITGMANKNRSMLNHKLPTA
jgi:hypothetical protein